MNTEIYKVPHGGQDSLHIKDQLAILPKTDPTDRAGKRAIKREFAKCLIPLSKLEAEYCARVLDVVNTNEDLDLVYQLYLEVWAKELYRMTKLKMFKLCTPNARYFEHKYKPVSPNYKRPLS